MRIYLDAPPVIYHVEDVSPYAARVLELLTHGAPDLIASDLTRLECRVKPLREGSQDRLADFDASST